MGTKGPGVPGTKVFHSDLSFPRTKGLGYEKSVIPTKTRCVLSCICMVHALVVWPVWLVRGLYGPYETSDFGSHFRFSD